MNKEQTAMQILIDDLTERLSTLKAEREKEIQSTSYRAVISTLEIVIGEAKSLLQKEQEQIENAFDALESVRYLNGTKFYKSGEHYYQSKYGGEDEN